VGKRPGATARRAGLRGAYFDWADTHFPYALAAEPKASAYVLPPSAAFWASTVAFDHALQLRAAFATASAPDRACS